MNTYANLLSYILGELESLGFGTDDDINGPDLVESIGVLYEQLAAERAEMREMNG